MHQWFFKDVLWHAFNLDSAEALCGETSITYGVDPIAQLVPSDGEAHDGCLDAIAEAAEEAEEAESDDDEDEKPKRAKKAKK
jgi:hypothetical protein